MNWVQRQFYALYESEMPDTVELNGLTYQRRKTFKYDFFAATGLYEHEHENESAQAVIKIFRVRRFFGLTMRWSGRMMAAHETRLYQHLAGIEGIPGYLGPVGQTGFAHEFIVGGELHRSSDVDDDFFPRLAGVISAIHDRGVAYVDFNKAENILLGDDGRPYLIDFQISYAPRLRFFLTNIILRRFQAEDRYHYLKHKRRIRRDQLSEQELADAYRRSIFIRVHRVLSNPYFVIRRSMMKLLKLQGSE